MCLLFCKRSIFGVSIHYPHQTSNAWCATRAETSHCHAYTKKRCFVVSAWLGIPTVKSFHLAMRALRESHTCTRCARLGFKFEFKYPAQESFFSWSIERFSYMWINYCDLQDTYSFITSYWNKLSANTVTFYNAEGVLWSFLLLRAGNVYHASFYQQPVTCTVELEGGNETAKHILSGTSHSSLSRQMTSTMLHGSDWASKR